MGATNPKTNSLIGNARAICPSEDRRRADPDWVGSNTAVAYNVVITGTDTTDRG
jgi:hypothetical protein